MVETIEKFIAETASAIRRENFVKLTLGHYKGADADLQKILIRPVETKKGALLQFVYRRKTSDTTKNFEIGAAVKMLSESIGKDFLSAHLFTTENDWQLDCARGAKARLTFAKATFPRRPDLKHDREKKSLVDPEAYYLKALGITTEAGAVCDKQQDKWRQINKFVETLSALFDKSSLKDRRQLKIVDMGSGKGYLTFAAYDFFANRRNLNVEITGVETRAALVSLCNEIARASEFENLKFVESDIENFEIADADILVALHACNTATDEAIYKGIRAEAALILAAPCCHQEIRPQIKPPRMLENILKHGIILEREAESITDGLRALLLEKAGYATRIFEFISTEHTPKNNMIAATFLGEMKNEKRLADEIAEIKNFYGITEQRLERLLKDFQTDKTAKIKDKTK